MRISPHNCSWGFICDATGAFIPGMTMNAFLSSLPDRVFNECGPSEECNGLAVIPDWKVISADIFGNGESYRYYFPMLRDAAFTLSHPGDEKDQPDMHEAYFKALAAIDDFNDAGHHPEEDHPGAGTLQMVETQQLVGFSLMHGEELIHNAFFSR